MAHLRSPWGCVGWRHHDFRGVEGPLDRVFEPPERVLGLHEGVHARQGTGSEFQLCTDQRQPIYFPASNIARVDCWACCREARSASAVSNVCSAAR